MICDAAGASVRFSSTTWETLLCPAGLASDGDDGRGAGEDRGADAFEVGAGDGSDGGGVGRVVPVAEAERFVEPEVVCPVAGALVLQSVRSDEVALRALDVLIREPAGREGCSKLHHRRLDRLRDLRAAARGIEPDMRRDVAGLLQRRVDAPDLIPDPLPFPQLREHQRTLVAAEQHVRDARRGVILVRRPGRDPADHHV